MRLGTRTLVLILMHCGVASIAEATEIRALGFLQWTANPDRYEWRMEWQPVAEQRDDGWHALSPQSPPAVDGVHAPSEGGTFTIDDWAYRAALCETTQVGLGRWMPGTLPPTQRMENPLLATSTQGWTHWPIEDAAAVWKLPGRSELLGAALNGLSKVALDALRKHLPRLLEVDPDVPWNRETFRLAQSWDSKSVELVGSFTAGIRVRGQHTTVAARLQYWIGYQGGAHVVRYAWVDLDNAGEATQFQRWLGAAAPPGADRPLVFTEDARTTQRRHTILELNSAGQFVPVLSTPWTGCAR